MKTLKDLTIVFSPLSLRGKGGENERLLVPRPRTRNIVPLNPSSPLLSSSDAKPFRVYSLSFLTPPPLGLSPGVRR